MDRYAWTDEGINFVAEPDDDLKNFADLKSKTLTIQGAAGREILRLAERVRELEGQRQADMEIRSALAASNRAADARVVSLEETIIDAGRRYSCQIQEFSDEVTSRGARIKALDEENARLRAELQNLKDELRPHPLNGARCPWEDPNDGWRCAGPLGHDGDCRPRV